MPLDSEPVQQALRALYTFVARQAEAKKTTATPLFDDDGFIYLQLSLKKTPVKPTTKPIPIPLIHPLLTPSSSICLITKDPPRPSPTTTPSSSRSSRSSSRPYPYLPPASLQSYFTAHPIPSLTLLPLTQLRREYHRFADRRALLSLHDLFLADDRVLPLLPSLLGAKFFDKKRQPAPVDLRVHDKAQAVRAAMQCTWMFVPSGSSMQVKVGRLSMSRAEVGENVMAAVEAVVRRVPGKWRNVQMVGVKTQDSITLPVYSSLPLQAIRGVKGAQGDGTEGEVEDDEGEGEGEEKQAEEEGVEEEEGGEDGGGEEEVAASVPPVLKASQKRKRAEDSAPVPPVMTAPSNRKRQQFADATTPATNGHSTHRTDGAAATKPSKATPRATPSKSSQVKAKASPQPRVEEEEDEEEEDEITLNMDPPAESLPTPSKKQRTQPPTPFPARPPTPAKLIAPKQVQPSPAQKKAAAVPLPTATPPAPKAEKGKVSAAVVRRKSLPAPAGEAKKATQRVAPGSARKVRG